MTNYISMTIDGIKLKAPKGTAVLDVALEYGTCIPHLCHVPTLSDFGACRLCIVELVSNGRSKVTTSCTLEVKEGMVVYSNSDRIRNLRKNVAELLVSEAPNSRAIQDMALRCGVKDVRYPFRNKECILCGRCVRVCEEIWGAQAIGFIGRGEERRVDYPFGRSELCKLCRSCIDLCPMTMPPCEGPMLPGEEYFCGKCESELSVNETFPENCAFCDLGKNFQCARH